MKILKLFFLATLVTSSAFASIPLMSQKDFSSLIKDANNTSLAMSERWQALVKAAEIVKPEQVPTIANFSKNKDWFMRNAALVSLETINIEDAIEQAKILISDKALVVRSAAVATLAKKNTLAIRQLFATELAKSYNYSGSQSLWIRAQLMGQIANKVSADDRQFMARYLFDSDKKVANLSVEALEKITAVHFEGKNQLEQWQTHVKKNNWL